MRYADRHKGTRVSDISIQFTLWDFIIAAPVFGWPGLILGGACGALVWKERRILAAVLGAAVGCALWFAVSVLLL